MILVRAASLALGSVQPEAVALTFMMTLPIALGITLGISGVVIGAAAVRDCFSGRARANPTA